MKINKSTPYTTRKTNSPVTILSTAIRSENNHNVVGIIHELHNDIVTQWTDSGYWKDNETEHALDLIPFVPQRMLVA